LWIYAVGTLFWRIKSWKERKRRKTIVEFLSSHHTKD
jgi:hypothetical protein